jgi:hypothetical protein
MNLLPQMGSENLDQTDFQSRDFTMHKNTSKIQLYLETNIDISSVDSRRPPQGEASIGDLI